MIPVIVSIIYVLIVIGVSGIVYSKVKNSFMIRKIIHIGMASWWFIRLHFLDSKILWLGPALFILVNLALSIKYGFEKGIVHFAISLTGLTLLSTIYNIFVFPATAAILVLGYADPIAAMAGRIRQIKKKLKFGKSLFGSSVFLIVTFIVLIIVCRIYCVNISVVVLFLIAVITSFSEARIFPHLDNIVIPSVVFMALCII